MFKVIITKGAWAGQTGLAAPSRAIGPVGQRTFLVLVKLDNGAGSVELPVDAVQGVK